MTSMQQSKSIPTLLPGPHLDNTFGAHLIGTFAATALFGVTSVQVIIYYRLYPTDGYTMKTLVAVLWILGGLHSVLGMHGSYHYLVTNYFNPPALLKPVWSSSLGTSGVSGVIILLAHGFYLHRVFVVSRRNWLLSAIILVLMLLTFGFALAVTIATFQLKLYADVSGVPLRISRYGLSFALVTDVLIASSLTFYLHKGRTGHRRTDGLVKTLIIITIHNTALTSVLDLLVLIFENLYPHTLIYPSFFLIVAPLYTNSLLSSVNARQSLRLKQQKFSQLSAMQLSLSHLDRTSGAQPSQLDEAILDARAMNPAGVEAHLQPFSDVTSKKPWIRQECNAGKMPEEGCT